MEMIKVRDNVRIDILTENIEPLYKDEIKNKISDNKCWRVTGSIFETLSKILISGGAILSFSSGYYNSPTLSFISGSVSTVSLAFLQFSAYCHKEQVRNISELNMLLKKLNIETFPNSNYISSNRINSNKPSSDDSIKAQSEESNKSNNDDTKDVI